MVTLTGIPFSPDIDTLMEQARVASGSDDAAALRQLAEEAVRAGRPKAAYGECFIESRNGDTVRIGGVSFTSRMLVRNLEPVERAFPVLATCGHEMDEAAPRGADMLEMFWWDLIKQQMLTAASAFLEQHLRRRFRLGTTAIMRPGAGDAAVWPIEQQRNLFALLGDVEREIGVRLTDSFLMVPNKTTSGILFPTERDFRSCEVCHREGCEGRQAPFNQELWDEISGEE